MLNCFSYTCSFGVHARVGGAREVINTDISRKILERGKNNYQLNGLSTAAGEFIKADSVSFLQRAFKKGNNFDVIILDPPSFARHEGQVFQVKRDLPKLIALAVAVLNPGGSLLVTTNYSEISYADLERMLARGLNGRRVAHIQRVGQDEDFSGRTVLRKVIWWGYGSSSFRAGFIEIRHMSRSQTKRWIEAGRIAVNGHIIKDPAFLVVPETVRITIDGKPVARAASCTIMLYKPRGIVTTKSDEKGRKTVYDLLPAHLQHLASGRTLGYGEHGFTVDDHRHPAFKFFD